MMLLFLAYLFLHVAKSRFCSATFDGYKLSSFLTQVYFLLFWECVKRPTWKCLGGYWYWQKNRGKLGADVLQEKKERDKNPTKSGGKSLAGQRRQRTRRKWGRYNILAGCKVKTTGKETIQVLQSIKDAMFSFWLAHCVNERTSFSVWSWYWLHSLCSPLYPSSLFLYEASLLPQYHIGTSGGTRALESTHDFL